MRDEAGMDAAIRLDLMLHAFMFMQSGIPVIYSGDEVGQVNDYSYKEDPEKREDSGTYTGENSAGILWRRSAGREPCRTVCLQDLTAWRACGLRIRFLTAGCPFIWQIQGINPCSAWFAGANKRQRRGCLISAGRKREFP